MSGGSFDYMYSRIMDTYFGHLEDKVLDELIYDLCEVLKELEWWQSGDTLEVDYREAVAQFKGKWLSRGQTETSLEAIESIKRYCERTQCRKCDYGVRHQSNIDYVGCSLQETNPCDWKIAVQLKEIKETDNG